MDLTYIFKSFLCVLLPDWQCKEPYDLNPQQNCWKLFKMNHLKYLEMILRAQEKRRNTHSRKSTKAQEEKQYYVVLEPKSAPSLLPFSAQWDWNSTPGWHCQEQQGDLNTVTIQTASA